jgi:hypothetical protein
LSIYIRQRAKSLHTELSLASAFELKNTLWSCSKWEWNIFIFSKDINVTLRLIIKKSVVMIYTFMCDHKR